MTLVILFLYSLNAFAFDNDYTIHRTNFNLENFLDINSVQPNAATIEQWHRSETGWRITSHSLSGDLLYSSSEIKFKSDLSERVNFHLYLKDEFFYVDKPNQTPSFEFEYTPFKYALSFSIISTVDYQKAETDMGIAVTLGQRTGNYLQIKDITIDPLFDEKNSDPLIDQASYTKNQHILNIESAYQWDSQYQMRLLLRDLSEMNFIFDDQITTFTHSGYEYDISLMYQKNKNEVWRLQMKGFRTDKTLNTTGSAQIQQLNYQSADLQWMIRQNRPYKYLFGIRDDVFDNDISDAINNSNNLDYRFSTTQIYSSVQHAYNENREWNVGVYVGLTREPYDFTQTDTAIFARQYQSQLRLSWIINSKDRKSLFKIHGSLNLDDIIDDPGDGLGVTYQSVF